jgi:RNA polymerase sigma-70 factor (ECF subfamily)
MVNHHLLDDKELVSLYQQGDQIAISQLVTRYKSRVFTSIFFLVRNREVAEDLFQETFIKIISSLRSSTYNEQGKFLPWALRIAHNLVIDHFRKEKLMPLQRDSDEFSVFDVLPGQGRNAADQLVYNEKIQFIRSLIDRLPPDQREIVILRHYTGLSFKEIAKTLNININTALGRMHYAVIKLREMVAKAPERARE